MSSIELIILFQGNASDGMSSDSLKQENERLRQEIASLRRGAVNAGFLQVSKAHIDALNELATTAPAAHKTLWKICAAMNKQNALMVSQDSLAKLTGYSKATLKRAISLLREQQWLEVLKVGTANVYRVNSAVFWQARADGRWASFSAQVLVNFDEQDAQTQAAPAPKLRHIPFLEHGEDVIVQDDGNTPPPDQGQLEFHR